jgi:hypothetical protein
MTKRPRKETAVVCMGLGLLVAVVFWRVIAFDFINFDDPDYVTDNSPVRAGLTLAGVKWALTTGHAGNWHPVTWVSHMLDVEVFGLWAGGHHLTNVVLHFINSVLLYTFFLYATGAKWRSAFLAAVFAIHPTRVESVAWVSERKDLLSGLFFLLTLLAYAAYARRHPMQKTGEPRDMRGPATTSKHGVGAYPRQAAKLPPKSTSDSGTRYAYWLALGFLALGLMCKPMLVTVPFVLLLLDIWPLSRFAGLPVKALILEKAPFFLLSLVSCWVTVMAQSGGGAIESLSNLTLWQRISNSLVAYARYLSTFFWPTDLAVFYPHPGDWAPIIVLAAGAALAAVSIAVVSRRKQPYAFVGWFLFVGMLVPVIGLVQVGSQSMADRYTYLPFIGLLVVVAWAGDQALPGSTYLRMVLCGFVVGVCAVLTSMQLSHWRNSETLFARALAVTRNNPVAHFGYARALISQGRLEEGRHHLESALRLAPRMAKAKGELALILTSEGKLRDALNQYEQALAIRPNLPEALNNLAWLRATRPEPDLRNGEEAVRLATKACEVTAWQRTVIIGTLAAAYAEAGDFSGAIATAQRAISNAEQWGEADLAVRNRQLLEEYYRKGKPVRDPAGQSANH